MGHERNDHQDNTLQRQLRGARARSVEWLEKKCNRWIDDMLQWNQSQEKSEPRELPEIYHIANHNRGIHVSGEIITIGRWNWGCQTRGRRTRVITVDRLALLPSTSKKRDQEGSIEWSSNHQEEIDVIITSRSRPICKTRCHGRVTLWHRKFWAGGWELRGVAGYHDGRQGQETVWKNKSG